MRHVPLPPLQAGMEPLRCLQFYVRGGAKAPCSFYRDIRRLAPVSTERRTASHSVGPCLSWLVECQRHVRPHCLSLSAVSKSWTRMVELCIGYYGSCRLNAVPLQWFFWSWLFLKKKKKEGVFCPCVAFCRASLEWTFGGRRCNQTNQKSLLLCKLTSSPLAHLFSPSLMLLTIQPFNYKILATAFICVCLFSGNHKFEILYFYFIPWWRE